MQNLLGAKTGTVENFRSQNAVLRELQQILLPSETFFCNKAQSNQPSTPGSRSRLSRGRRRVGRIFYSSSSSIPSLETTFRDKIRSPPSVPLLLVIEAIAKSNQAEAKGESRSN